MQSIEVDSRELMLVYKEGQKSGFIAGVIFCVGVHYLLKKQKKIR